MLLGPSCGAGFSTVTVLDRDVALLFAGHEDKGNACVQMRSVGSLYCLRSSTWKETPSGSSFQPWGEHLSILSFLVPKHFVYRFYRHTYVCINT